MLALNERPLLELDCCRDLPDGGHRAIASIDPELAAGHVLDGSFVIRETLSRSGMATLYRADVIDEPGLSVVVKVPLLKVERDPVWHDRFLREQAVAAQFDHPWLLKVYPTEHRRKSRPYLVTEYLRGCTLNRLLERSKPLPERDALKLARTVCEALAHMHARGFVHCDINPSNIFLCADGSLRVIDYGLACPPIQTGFLTSKLRPIYGTPFYMSPEQVSGGLIDSRTDVYSLGIVLYEMLTGAAPFPNEDGWESAFARTTGDPLRPRDLNPALSPQAEEIVLHALQRNVSDRYATALAFKSDLDSPDHVIMTGYGDRLRPPKSGLSFHTTPILFGLILGGGVLSALVGAFFVLRGLLMET